MKKILLIILMIFLVGCSNNTDSGLISYIDAKEKIINDGAILVDVRTEDEYEEKHINGSILLSVDNINEENASDIIESKDSIVIVYCQSGNRSSQAVDILNGLGYNNVYDLGSINNWEE